MIIMLMPMTRKRRLTVMMKWSREESQVFNPTGNCRGLNGRFCLCLRLCLYICLCVHHVHVKASPWVKTISIQPAFSVFISIIIDWHCVTLWLSWAGNREWEIMYSNRREIMSSYGAISKWPSGKWLPRSQKWMKKNSDKSHSSIGMFPHRFGCFLPSVIHLASEKLILPIFSMLRGVAVSVCFPEVRNRKQTESGLGGCACSNKAWLHGSTRLPIPFFCPSWSPSALPLLLRSVSREVHV